VGRVSFKNPGQAKRRKEIAREQWQKQKAERRAQRDKEKGTRSETSEGEDPDIAGIVPGPQPPADEGTGGEQS
jgi:hypothetical protein